MTRVETTYEHIVLNESGIPEIADSGMKVVELVTEHLSFGWSPEELYLNHPYLTMGQIHSALAYYWDHKVELDADMQSRSNYVQRLRKDSRPSPIATRLQTYHANNSG